MRLRVHLAELMREETELSRQGRVMLRSGSFLPKYADRILRPQDRHNTFETLHARISKIGPLSKETREKKLATEWPSAISSNQLSIRRNDN